MVGRVLLEMSPCNSAHACYPGACYAIHTFGIRMN